MTTTQAFIKSLGLWRCIALSWTKVFRADRTFFNKRLERVQTGLSYDDHIMVTS